MNVNGQVYIPADLKPGEESPLLTEWKDGMDGHCGDEKNFCLSREKTLVINPLNAELNPICHLLALLGGATIVVVSSLRVKRETCLTHLHDKCITRGRMSHI